MLVHELIDMLKDYPADQEVELVIVAPVGDNEDDDITVDRYPIDGIMPWDDEDTKETVSAVQSFVGDDHVKRFYSDNADELVNASRFLGIPHEASQQGMPRRHGR